MVEINQLPASACDRCRLVYPYYFRRRCDLLVEARKNHPAHPSTSRSSLSLYMLPVDFIIR